MRTIYLHCSNHFDPIWRRGFKKPFYYKDEKYVGNFVIEEACISEWIGMSADPSLKFEVECSFVLRAYLEEHPEHLETLRRLLKEGRFELMAAGEIIPDPHMPIGETLVRNMTYGLWWAEDTLGVLPATGCANDGFGTSAQMPQIFRGVGVDWLTGLSYGFPTKHYWRGLDGTSIYINQDFRTKNTKYVGRTSYYRPCPDCRGEGCTSCLGRGFDHSYRMDGSLDETKLDMDNYPFGWIEAGGEENLVPLDLPAKVARKNAESGSEYRYEFKLIKELAERYREDIEAVESPDPARVSPEVEGRPVSSGCWVSRIKTKQEVRRLENKTEALEKWAAFAHAEGFSYPGEELADGWRNIAFAAFHDSITGTHVDVGYEELLELYAGTDDRLDAARLKLERETIAADGGAVSVFNPLSYEATQVATVLLPGEKRARVDFLDERGEKAAIYETAQTEGGLRVGFRVDRLAGLTWRTYRIVEAASVDAVTTAGDAVGSSVENDFYNVVAGPNGIMSIFDKRAGKELVDASKGYANELVLEHDVGDPWTTRELNRPRLRLGVGTHLVGVERRENHSVITYRGRMPGNDVVQDPLDYRVLILEWEQRVILRDGIPRVDFETWIDWDAFDRRIRVSFPTPVAVKNDPGHYAIPYGTLTRDRYEMGYTGWENANGDWPAVEWASTASPTGINVAIFNQGTPSCRIERGELLVSVLRSPTFPNCLLWPREYNAPAYDGMRDQGEHLFAYSLYSYEGHWSGSQVVREAYAYNKPFVAVAGRAKPSASFLSLKANHALISALKKEERGEGTIVRLFEHAGKGEEATLTLPASVRSVRQTDLLERDEREIPVSADGTVTVKLAPFQIATLKLSKD